ncbi:Pycsar system effector family protein [Streptomyces sp. RFCAC02]|uniref:Pycsar system effector family protein n=1 Tax=Streptomyces sp. RFCAC02 TaxID=2499143 RepID=UPI0010219841|nr:Pycsar system effector family protein [Streptomyces sp. RFCAC02]
MSDIDGSCTATEHRAGHGLATEAAVMFTEVQRADSKATTLCGVAGGMLGVDIAALSAVRECGGLPLITQTTATILLAVALITAMYAIRPALPRDGRLRTFACTAPANDQSESGWPACSVVCGGDHLRAEAARLAMFTTLAQQKFRAIKWAVDFVATATTVATLGLLIPYVSS